ncbi:MAG: DegT/DnrJ/EryC1/StrS family aminotransferase [Gemmatimonadales bacterium]|nr:DegT/DnrJ/EryC1/StrS family aminotransferase [Gemmatimonadales bacterium]
MPRVMPPAWSPVALRTLGSAVAGLARPGRAGADLAARLSATFGATTVTGTDCGTTALRLALAAARSGNRAAVALPAWGCFDLATAADGAGAPVRLYDIDPATLGPDWPSLERAIAGGVAAVVVVHPFGLAVDVERARTLARAGGAVLIEDAAQGAGASLQGRLVGSFGDWSVLSFGRGKGLTGGGGGALLARGPVAERPVDAPAEGSLGVKSLLLLAAMVVASRPAVYGVLASLPFLGLGETPYHPPHPPAGLPGPSAAAVLDTLTRLDRAGEERRALAERLAARARALVSGSVPEVLAGSRPSYLRLPVVLPEGRSAGPAAARLGIMPGYPKALVDLEGFVARVENRADDFPGARQLARRLVTLPTHRWVGRGDELALEHWLEHTLGVTR